METRICDEKHQNINETLNKHEHRLDLHDEKLEKLDCDNVAHSKDIEMLCSKITDLVDSNKWFIRLFGASLVGFFFYIIQQSVSK